jgi:hypothetical protein
MNRFKQLVVSAAILVGLGLLFAPAGAGAVNAIEDTCADPLNANSTICKNKGDNVQNVIGAVVNTLLFLLGIAAVIVIIIGGITYTTSSGEAAAIKRAKDMILYAVVGLVIAFAAYAIVNWVIKAFG